LVIIPGKKDIYLLIDQMIKIEILNYGLKNKKNYKNSLSIFISINNLITNRKYFSIDSIKLTIKKYPFWSALLLISYSLIIIDQSQWGNAISYKAKWSSLLLITIFGIVVEYYEQVAQKDFKNNFLIIFIIISVISLNIFYSIDSFMSFIKVLTYMPGLLISFIIIPNICKSTGIKLILNLLFYLFLLILLVSIIGGVLIPEIFFKCHIYRGIEYFRLKGIFSNSNLMGIFCFILLVLTFLKTNLKRHYQFIISFLTIYTICLTHSRASLLTALIFLNLIFVYKFRNAGITLLSFEIIMILLIPYNQFLNEYFRLQVNITSFRNNLWWIAFDSWKDNLFWGTGIYSTNFVINQSKYNHLFIGNEWLLGGSFHSIYLSLLCEMGITGIVLYIILVIRFYNNKSKYISNERFLILSSAIVSILIYSFFESSALSLGHIIGITCWVFVGIMNEEYY
jgi:hypothetical protein